MEDTILPQGIIEKILGYADGKTLLACRDISPKFVSALAYLESHGVWKKCASEEIPFGIIYNIIVRLYAHVQGYDHRSNWRMVCSTWTMLEKVDLVSRWNVTNIKCATVYTLMNSVLVHGNVILVLLKYHKNFQIYYKIITLDENGDCMGKSCRIMCDSIFITTVEENEMTDDDIGLFCENCNLIGVPSRAEPFEREFPKLAFDKNFLRVEYANGNLLHFNNAKGLLGMSNCTYARINHDLSTEQGFIDVTYKPQQLEIACDDILKKCQWLSVSNGVVTCAKSCLGLIIIGTETGTLYGYYCKNKDDVGNFDVKNYMWKISVCYEAIRSADVLMAENYFKFICCSDQKLYIISPRD